jgi:hypothetical protein
VNWANVLPSDAHSYCGLERNPASFGNFAESRNKMDSGVAAPPRLLSFGGKSGNPRRIHRLKTTGRLEGLLKERHRIAASEDDIGEEIHRLMETLDRCNGLASRMKWSPMGFMPSTPMPPSVPSCVLVLVTRENIQLQNSSNAGGSWRHR